MSGGAEDGVGGVAVATLEIAPPKMAVALGVSDELFVRRIRVRRRARHGETFSDHVAFRLDDLFLWNWKARTAVSHADSARRASHRELRSLMASGPAARIIFHVCGRLLEFSNWVSAHETDRTSLVQISGGPLEMCTRDAL